MSDTPNENIENQAVNSAEVTADTEAQTDSPSEVTDTSDSVEVQSSDRAENRYQKLANGLKEAKQEAETLRKQLEGYKSSNSDFNSFTSEYKPQPLDTNELTADQLNNYIVSTADQIVNLRLNEMNKRESKIRNFEKGIQTIETKYNELNPDSDKFDVNLSNKITNLYSKASKVNPDVDILDFVEDIMTVRNYSTDKAVSEVKKETVLQEANSAVTPSNEKVSTMTKEEELIEMLKSGKLSAKEAEKLLSSN